MNDFFGLEQIKKMAELIIKFAKEEFDKLCVLSVAIITTGV